MRFPVTKAFGATLAYLARHWPDLLKAMWLPALLLVALELYAAGPFLSALVEILRLGAQPEASEALDALSRIGKWSLILMAGSAIAYPMLTAASLRHLVRGDELKAPAYIGYGGDELRLLAAYILLTIMILLISLVGDLATGALAAILSLSGGEEAARAIGNLLVNAVTIWFQLRLLTLYAASLATRTIGFNDAWASTKGQVLRLLGFWILIGVVYVPAALVLVSPFIPEMFPLMAQFSQVGADPQAAREAATAILSAVAALFSPEHPRFWLTAALLFAGTLVLTAIANVASGTAWRYLTGGVGDAAKAPSAGAS